MQDAKKFLLVESSDLNKLLRENQLKERLQPLPTRELHQLDSDMLKIVNDPTLSQEEKVKRYNSILTEFQSVSHYDNPPKTSNSETKNSDVKESSPDPILGIPKIYKRKAENLMTYLKHANMLNISDKGELIIKDEKIDKSNVTDILNKAVNPKATVKNPIGWNQFQSLLEENNVPQSMVSSDISIKKEDSKQGVQSNSTHSRIPLRSKRKTVSKSVTNPLESWVTHDSISHGKKKKKNSN